MPTGPRIGVSDSVYANRPQSRQTDPVVFRGEIQQDGDRVFTVAPGTDITVTLTATDDGSPITDQTVELFFGYQNVPVYSTTVKTDSKGTVTESISLPDNAPDGTDLIAHAMMSYEGKTHEAFPSANIRSLDVPFIYPALEPGTENEISYEVTDMKTGEPVEGVNTYLSLQYETARTGTFETGRLRSGSDGTDTETVTVPDDVHFQPSLIQLGPYHLGIAGALLDPKRPGTLSMPQKLSPGETVDVTFEAPDGTTATGFVSVDVWGANHVFGSSFRSNEQFSLEIPEYSGIEDFLSIANAGFATAWAIGEDGSLYQDEQYVRFVDKDSVGLVMKPQSKTLESGGSAEIDLVVTGAARGIGGYSLAATVKDVDILTIGEYTITGEPATSDVSLADDGSRISIDVDMGSNPHESGDVTVATLTVEAEKKGETTVSLGNIAVSDANGNAYDLRNTSGASVTVTESTGPPPVVGDSKPTDIDDDGKYEDIDGDGQLSVRDVQLYFQEIYKKRDSEYVKNNRQYFDYNDDGTISVQDLQLLFREYTGQSG